MAMDGKSLPVLRKFALYETRTRYYLIGRTKDRKHWRVLKLSRLEAADLDVTEDPGIYSEGECARLLSEINDGNLRHGGSQLILQVPIDMFTTAPADYCVVTAAFSLSVCLFLGELCCMTVMYRAYAGGCTAGVL